MNPTQFQAIAKQLSPEKIMEVGLSCFSSKVLLTAVELRVFTILSQATDDRRGAWKVTITAPERHLRLS